MIKLMTLSEVAKMTRLSKSTIYRLLEEDKFPPPKRLSTARVLWSEPEVEKWIMEK